MNRRFDDFDKEYNRTRNFILIAWFFGAVITIAVLGFIGWVIVMLMRFFGVI